MLFQVMWSFIILHRQVKRSILSGIPAASISISSLGSKSSQGVMQFL
jgi:hypothetical protein